MNSKFSSASVLTWTGGLLVLAGLIAAILWWNQGYGQVSEQGYALGKALFSACNQRDADRIGKISELINQSREDGSLSDQESKWLDGIVNLAQNQQWDRASREAREIMEDQIAVSADLPQLD